MSDIQAIRTEIKNMRPHVERKDVKKQIINQVVPTDIEAKQRAEKARKNAHILSADVKREISMEIKNKLSECFDFIEESCGSGSPEFEFFDSPQTVSECVVDGVVQGPNYPIIGRATGVFAPIGVMSRNNRIYDNDHYDYLLGNQNLVDRISHRGMLGTIGHHDKKVDDQDLADGKVSHIVSDLHIKEEADGTRNLYGTLEILDTPAGHLLKTYYDSGIPLFVSSRGGGNLIQNPHESFKRVDKTKYFLETFDIVKNPGFLQAKPVYEKIGEEKEEVNEQPNEVVMSTSEAKEEDKIDRLVSALTSVLEAISESKEEKAEDNEKKETKEKKEVKEKSETKETKNAEITEEKKKKEDDKPEDEKNEDAESAVADSVVEELSKGAQELKDKLTDTKDGLTPEQIAKGYKQTKIYHGKDVDTLVNMQDKYDKDQEERKEKFKAGAKEQKTPKRKEVAQQLKLGLQEKKEEKAEIKDKLKAGAKEKVKIQEPITFDSLDIARALKEKVKKAE